MRLLIRTIGLAAALAVAASSCASLDDHFTGPVQVTEERHFRTEWQLQHDDIYPVARIDGYIYNTWNYYATQVQVLVEALDTGEQVVERRFQWVPGGVPPQNRTYFEVRDLPLANHYRVSVPYVTWEDGGPRRGIFRLGF